MQAWSSQTIRALRCVIGALKTTLTGGATTTAVARGTAPSVVRAWRLGVAKRHRAQGLQARRLNRTSFCFCSERGEGEYMLISDSQTIYHACCSVREFVRYIYVKRHIVSLHAVACVIA